jgi:Tol biopolymer transport system component
VGYDDARYSADGRKVYFRQRMRQSPTQVAYALMEQDLITSQQRVLLDESVRGRDLAGIRPSPDGRYLAYGTVDRAGSKDAFIHIRPVNEGQTREVRIPASEASLCHPMDWIKDSSAVIYHCDAPSGTSSNGSKTWILPMADLKPRQLDLGFSEVMLSVHPDGKRIAFSVNRPNRTELHVLENFLPAAK